MAGKGGKSGEGMYYGWAIVWAATALTLLTVGLRLGAGPFFLPMTQDLGMSRSELSSIIAAGMLTYGLTMPLAGQLVTSWGTRRVLLVGMLFVAGSIAGTIYAQGPISLALSYGVGLSIGLALASPVSLTPVISRWFVRQRGMALFVLSAGSMAGIAILTPLFTSSISAFGWQATLAGFAVVFSLITFPSALFVIRDQAPEHADTLSARNASGTPALAQASCAVPPPAAAAQARPLRAAAAVRTLPFWQLTLGLFACGFSMNLLGTHGVPMLMDHGFDSQTSAFGIALIGLVAIFSSFALGKLSDMVERRYILAVIYTVRGLGFFGLVEALAPWQLYGVASVGGIVWAGSVALSSAIMADVYGTRLVGVLCGWAYVGHQVGGMISSWLGGWAYEAFGTHLIAFGAAGLLLFGAAAISLGLPSRGVTVRARPVATAAE
ncbi:MFS transporter [Parapusillimonas granuli]|uniref:MFS transporter n=1 Tax=Parapusillimonas granuli TaxID=380911 RepID=A0A853FYI0_9BURK|nr:MFS transporter [Parapusillimonas granuli]MBB5215384.1 MFS family permease [Parapusillimonas granuli]NYT49948.1 MFS transporter [Parapusillimonas granuli]